jgi:hypothetical protein
VSVSGQESINRRRDRGGCEVRINDQRIKRTIFVNIGVGTKAVLMADKDTKQAVKKSFIIVLLLE